MFRIGSEIELLGAFRPQDRRAIELPQKVSFPIFVRDYFTWIESSGNRIYLVIGDPGSMAGVIFRRDQKGGGLPLSRMCEWCHAYGSSYEIGLLTADVDDRRRVGVNLCLDLSCVSKAESAANLAGDDPRKPSKRIVSEMSRFVYEVLFEHKEKRPKGSNPPGLVANLSKADHRR